MSALHLLKSQQVRLLFVLQSVVLFGYIYNTSLLYTWCLQQLFMQQQSFFWNACASILFYYLV